MKAFYMAGICLIITILLLPAIEWLQDWMDKTADGILNKLFKEEGGK